MKTEELFDAIGGADEELIERCKQGKMCRPAWRKWAAIAACLCLAVLLAILPAPGADNFLSIKTYALALDEDGAVQLSEIDLLSQPDMWGGHFDGTNFYVNIGLKYEGENIKSVEFSTEKGFFAKQRIDTLKNGDGSALHVGADNRITVYGTDFENVGSTLTLSDAENTEDLLLFWGIQIADESEIPEKNEILARATFRDGKTQEVKLTIDLSGPGACSRVADEAEIQRVQAEWDYYKSLPLEQCELVEESVKTVTDVYESRTPLGSSTAYIQINDDTEFDENGIWLEGQAAELQPDGKSVKVYLTVIQRDSEGVLTGMVYRVPENLVYRP